MGTTPTEAIVKDVVADLAAEVEAKYAAASANWPKEAVGASDKVLQMVNEAVANFLAGDTSVLRDALVASVVSAITKGKSGASKAVSGLA